MISGGMMGGGMPAVGAGSTVPPPPMKLMPSKLGGIRPRTRGCCRVEPLLTLLVLLPVLASLMVLTVVVLATAVATAPPAPATGMPPSTLLQQSADVAVASAVPSNQNFAIAVVASAEA